MIDGGVGTSGSTGCLIFVGGVTVHLQDGCTGGAENDLDVVARHVHWTVEL